MKFAVSSYSFEKLGISQIETITRAKELGFDAIEFAELNKPEDMTFIEYAAKLADEASKQEIEISNLAVSANFLYGSNKSLDDEIARLIELVDCTEILGAKTMRHDVYSGINADDWEYFSYATEIERFAHACRTISDYAKTKGIKTMVENHGLYFQDVDRIEKLIDTVKSDNFGILADMGNFMCADQDSTYAIGKLAKHVFYCHAKDFYFKSGMLPNPGEGYMKTRSGNYIKPTIIGHGDVPVMQCLAILNNAGYDGYIGVEFEGLEETMQALRIGFSNLKRYAQVVK